MQAFSMKTDRLRKAAGLYGVGRSLLQPQIPASRPKPATRPGVPQSAALWGKDCNNGLASTQASNQTIEAATFPRTKPRGFVRKGGAAKQASFRVYPKASMAQLATTLRGKGDAAERREKSLYRKAIRDFEHGAACDDVAGKGGATERGEESLYRKATGDFEHGAVCSVPPARRQGVPAKP